MIIIAFMHRQFRLSFPQHWIRYVICERELKKMVKKYASGKNECCWQCIPTIQKQQQQQIHFLRMLSSKTQPTHHPEHYVNAMRRICIGCERKLHFCSLHKKSYCFGYAFIVALALCHFYFTRVLFNFHKIFSRSSNSVNSVKGGGIFSFRYMLLTNEFK
jgi:hypothetical protein